jgi:beta-xylosidase
MYAQMDNRSGSDENIKGVEVYVSTDLEHWQEPQPVLILADDSWARNMVWAPEMHE